MAKKKTPARRVPRAAEPRMFGDGKPSQAQPASATSAGKAGVAESAPRAAAQPARAGAAPRASSSGARLAAAARPKLPMSEEYKYVALDLRRLGITAASIFALLIVLGFIVR